VTDVLVLGSGPAGLLAARACGLEGLSVVLMSPDPDAPWAPHYGLWDDELLLLPGALTAKRWPGTDVIGDRTHELARGYALIDNARTQAAWRADAEEAGVRFERGSAADAPAAGVIVDATGWPPKLAPRGTEPTVWQVALGWRIRTDAHPYGDRMRLMDFTPRGGGRPARDTATFLYAMPFGPDDVFVEETQLIGPPMDFDELRARMEARLAADGVRVREIVAEERCVIPMDPGRPTLSPPIVPFGAAAAMVHPTSGYLLPRSAVAAPRLAAALAANRGDPDRAARAAWSAIWSWDDVTRNALQRFAARFLLKLSPEEVRAFFDVFFDCPPWVAKAFLSNVAPARDVAQAMSAVFGAVDWSTRVRMARASLG
jgi:lycopene beta-cyclase